MEPGIFNRRAMFVGRHFGFNRLLRLFHLPPRIQQNRPTHSNLPSWKRITLALQNTPSSKLPIRELTLLTTSCLLAFFAYQTTCRFAIESQNINTWPSARAWNSLLASFNFTDQSTHLKIQSVASQWLQLIPNEQIEKINVWVTEDSCLVILNHSPYFSNLTQIFYRSGCPATESVKKDQNNLILLGSGYQAYSHLEDFLTHHPAPQIKPQQSRKTDPLELHY